MKDDLKSYPFCGSEAELDLRQFFRHYHTGEPLEQVSIFCRSCGANISHYPGDLGCDRDTTAEFCIDEWNRRAEPLANEPDAVEGKARLMLLDLLAVIHRDGGHKTQEIGIELAWEQAILLSAERIAAMPASRGEVAQVVAWLRAKPASSGYDNNLLADAIERGDHRGTDGSAEV